MRILKIMNKIDLEEVQKNSFLFLQNFDYYDKFRKAFENPEVENYELWLQDNFFSEANIMRIQKALMQRVYDTTPEKFIIQPQKHEHIYQIMQGIFKDQCKFLPYDLKGQIDELNAKVVEFSYPFIVKEIRSMMEYQRFANNPVQPPPLPQTTSTQGKRTLPSTFIV